MLIHSYGCSEILPTEEEGTFSSFTSAAESKFKMVLRKSEKEQTRIRDGSHCDLCGCSAPAVRCEKCSHQIFCLSCDDMYHRHPKRRTHVRKAVDTAPPPPPKPVSKDVGDPIRLPVPPPRRRKSQSSQKSVPSSPLFSRKAENQNPPLPKKEFSFMDKVGSLRRFMIGRPLPPVPKDDDVPERPPKTEMVHELLHNQNNFDNECKNSYSNMSNRSGMTSPVIDGNSNSNKNFGGNDVLDSDFQGQLLTMQRKSSADLDGMSGRATNSAAQDWNNSSSKQTFNTQSSYPSTLIKSEPGCNVPMGFQGFPTLPKQNMFPNQYLDSFRFPNSMPTRMASDSQSNSVCDLHSSGPQHMGMPSSPTQFQNQQMQQFGYFPHNRMVRPNDPMINPCGMPYNSMPWMAHNPYQYYQMDPNQQFPPNVKRIPSSSSMNFSPTGSESGFRMNSYASMGHLHNPAMMVDNMAHLHSHMQQIPPNCPPSPVPSLQSAHRYKTQSVAADLGNNNPNFFRSGRRATAHGFPISGRRSNMDMTSSEEDYFSAGASDEDDFRSIRSGQSNFNKSHVPSRQWQCEHCTYVNSPGSRVCIVCCKTSARPKTMVSRRRRAGGGAKTPSSGDSLPPIAPRQSQRGNYSNSSTMQEAFVKNDKTNYPSDDDMEPEKELPELAESHLKINHTNQIEQINAENLLETSKEQELIVNGNAIDRIDIAREEPTKEEPTKAEQQEQNLIETNNHKETLHQDTIKKATTSTSTSPPPQHSATQTALAEEAMSDDYTQRPHLYRSNSRSSITGVDREIMSNLRRTSSVHMGTSNDTWGMPYSRRSSSRASLFGGSRDTSPLRSYRGDLDYPSYRDRRPSYEPLNRTDYYLSLEELIERRRQESMRVQGFELVRLLREAEQNNFNADDLQIALSHCGSQNPVQWLQDNWKNMIDTIVTLVTKYGKDKPDNDIGIISSKEAKDSLRTHKGNIWAAVTDCVEIRQKKFAELKCRGEQFKDEDIVSILTANDGNLEAAYLELTKNMLKPFHAKIWGPPAGRENTSLVDPPPTEPLSVVQSPVVSSPVVSSPLIPSPVEPLKSKSPRSKSPISPSVVTGTLTLPFGATSDLEDALSKPKHATGTSTVTSASPSSSLAATMTAIESTSSTDGVNPDENNYFEASQADSRLSPKAEEEISGLVNSLTLKNSTSDENHQSKETPLSSWRLAASGGGSAVGGAVIQDVHNDSVDFKPATTSRRLSRTGSFTGGLFQEKEIPIVDKNTSQISKIDDASDLYVTVQWASGQKPKHLARNKSPTPDPKEQINDQEGKVNILKEVRGDAVYGTVQFISTDDNLKNTKVKKKNLLAPSLENSPIDAEENAYSSIEFITNPTKTQTTVNTDIIFKDIQMQNPNETLPERLWDSNDIENIDDKHKDVNNPDDFDTLNDDTYTSVEFLMSQDSSPLSKLNYETVSNESKSVMLTNDDLVITDDVLKRYPSPSITDSSEADAQNIQMLSFDSPARGSPITYDKVELVDSVIKNQSPEPFQSPIMPQTTLPTVTAPSQQFPTVKQNDLQKSSSPQRTETSKSPSQYEFERHARMLLAEGKVATYEAAEIAVKLFELNFDEQDSLVAAEECHDLYSAVSFLQQDCELCTNKYPMGKMVSMLHCTHRCCQDCAVKYFSLLIRDKNIMEAICPFCNEPDLTDEDIAQEYFNNLDILLKSLVDSEVHELFQRKLRDRALMKDPNFHWCSQCSSGFIAHPFTKCLICPDCKIPTCAQCRKPWKSQHEGISCEQYAEWKDANDPEFQAKGLEKHLAENGIDCPNCRFRYALAKGGCMHFRCLQCKFDFCSGCGQPFKMGQKCNFSTYCGKLGLHAHHPRNCLFYLRDKEPFELQKLLTENGISFDTEPPAHLEEIPVKCPVMEQKEVSGVGLKDDICGNDVQEGFAGLCRLHYIEYLVGLINKHQMDPITVFDINDLMQELRRRYKNIPKQERLSDASYRNVLIKIIQEQIPLDETG